MGKDDSRNDRPRDRLTPANIHLPNFRMVRELGRGGMGVVFLAQQESLEREVAVKVFPAQGVKDTNLKRFFREVQLCVSLSHPHVVKLLDAGSTDEWAWLAMEYVQGQPLDRHVFANGAMKPSQLAIAMEELADALDFVHENKIVHRDIKPANVMKPDAGGLKLMDFGLARMDSSATLTDQGAVVGSPRYLAPETVTAGVMDTVTDLYGLGFLFYEVSTATRPYDNRSLRETLAGIVREVLPPPSRLEPGTPPEIDRIVMKLLAKNRDERYQTTQELLADVRGLRATKEFVGTSWETSRPSLDLLGSAADLLEPQAQAPADLTPTDPLRPKNAGRPSRRTAVPRSTGSFAASVPPEPPGTARVLGVAAVVGALIGVATIALVQARRGAGAGGATSSATASPGPAVPHATPASGANRSLELTVNLLSASVRERDAPQVLAAMEKAIGECPAGKPEKLRAWTRSTADWLLRQEFADRWRSLTSHHDRATLLEDGTVPLPLRRRLHNAALFYLHLDDFMTTSGLEPLFGAEALVRPWHTDVDAAGSSREEGLELCRKVSPGGACIEVMSNDGDAHWYAFFDEKDKDFNSPVHLIAGQVNRKYWDDPQPPLAVPGTPRTVTLWARTRYLFPERYFQLDLRPESSADGDIQVRTVVLRGRKGSHGLDRSALVGARVSAELVPAGKYSVRVRAFRLTGNEPTGMWMEDLWVQTGPAP